MMYPSEWYLPIGLYIQDHFGTFARNKNKKINNILINIKWCNL